MPGTRRKTRAAGSRKVRPGRRESYLEGAAVPYTEEESPRITRRDIEKQKEAEEKKHRLEEERRQEEIQERVREKRIRHEKEKQEREKERAIKASGTSVVFLVFLGIMCAFLLAGAVYYIHLKSTVTTKRGEIAVLESQLKKLKEDNDAYENQVKTDVDMVTVRKIALGRLGMKSPTEDQKEYYIKERSGYVRQFQDVPDTK